MKQISAIWRILKPIYQKLCTFIQWSKKFYFFHFLIVYLLPSNLLTIAAMLITPIYIIGGTIDSTLELIEDMIEPVGSSLFFMFFHSICAIIFGIVFQIVAMTIKSMLKGTILVTSNFLLNNKIYNKIYFYSMQLIIFSWLLISLYLLFMSIFS